MSTSKQDLSFLKGDFSKSIVGFFAALLVGALIPRTVQYVVRRVLLKSLREFAILALAGWLTDRIAHLITGPTKPE
jgi:hypothetical protein